jgi:hypothetical protein
LGASAFLGAAGSLGASAFFGAGFFSGSDAFSFLPNFCRRSCSCASSIMAKWLFISMPFSLSASMTSLLLTESSFAISNALNLDKSNTSWLHTHGFDLLCYRFC